MWVKHHAQCASCHSGVHFFLLVGWLGVLKKWKLEKKIDAINVRNIKLCMNKVPLVDLALFVSLSVVYHISSSQQCQTVLTELIKMKLCMIATVTLTVSWIYHCFLLSHILKGDKYNWCFAWFYTHTHTHTHTDTLSHKNVTVTGSYGI